MKCHYNLFNSGADPGFSVGGGTNPGGGGGSPTYDFAKISKKLHEIENILGRGGAPGAPGVPPLDPPLGMLKYPVHHYTIQ